MLDPAAAHGSVVTTVESGRDLRVSGGPLTARTPCPGAQSSGDEVDTDAQDLESGGVPGDTGAADRALRPQLVTALAGVLRPRPAGERSDLRTEVGRRSSRLLDQVSDTRSSTALAPASTRPDPQSAGAGGSRGLGQHRRPTATPPCRGPPTVAAVAARRQRQVGLGRLGLGLLPLRRRSLIDRSVGGDPLGPDLSPRQTYASRWSTMR
jgi:hypothetical protein